MSARLELETSRMSVEYGMLSNGIATQPVQQYLKQRKQTEEDYENKCYVGIRINPEFNYDDYLSKVRTVRNNRHMEMAIEKASTKPVGEICIRFSTSLPKFSHFYLGPCVPLFKFLYTKVSELDGLEIFNSTHATDKMSYMNQMSL
jgi:hypothetical protein